MTETLSITRKEVFDTQKNRFLLFLLDNETFGIEITYVTEIVGIQKICPLPDSQGYIKGVINLRGNVIPVIDMRLRLAKEPVPYTDRTCIIVIDMSGTAVGLIVDRVDEVIYIDDKDIVPPPSFNTGKSRRYIKWIGKPGGQIRLILDCERLFKTEELESLKQITK